MLSSTVVAIVKPADIPINKLAKKVPNKSGNDSKSLFSVPGQSVLIRHHSDGK